MKTSDEIITELWQTRDQYVKRHRNSLDAMITDLQKRQQKPFSRLVDQRRGRFRAVQTISAQLHT